MPPSGSATGSPPPGARALWTGGTVPIGYRVEARILTPVPEEAALVRRIFERYLALGSVTALKAELDAAGVRTPERQHRSGRCSGGAAFSRGRLYDLLSNPIFAGRIRHGDRVHPGQHAAIVDMGIWQAAQDQLAANRVSRSLRRGSRAPSPLAGRLVDPDGRAMRPSHASRKGRRYRYYLSGDLVDGSVATGATGWRVPAAEIEAAVARVLAARLRDPEFQAEALRGCSPAASASAKLLGSLAALADRLDAPGSTSGREALRLMVIGVELSDGGLRAEVRFPAPDAAGGHADPALAALPAFAVTAPLELQRRGPELRLVLQGAAAPPPRPDPRLVRTLVAARCRLAEYLDPDRALSVSAIARREGVDVGDVSRSLQLAFLAPDLVERILHGDQPVTLTAERLRRLGAAASPLRRAAGTARLIGSGFPTCYI